MDVDFEKTLKYKDLLSKFVKIKTVDRREHSGLLKNIDPITGNMIVITFNEDESAIQDTVLIMGDAYTEVEFVKDANNDIRRILQSTKTEQVIPDENVLDRKNRLVSFVKLRRLPVQENSDESLLVCGSVRILPPYRRESCVCDNLIILEKVMNMVDSLPPLKSH
ncbi:uncharacterized protein LOC129226499 [Uloborus diversus]|uniref:uncharacterized protein LOC129226499 n=1 Tax=Uloborus diversus TaxID=327109 RepID=UPI002409BDD0|nr:uncharacterized protein LOC129226499 [Uloborus diversus]